MKKWIQLSIILLCLTGLTFAESTPVASLTKFLGDVHVKKTDADKKNWEQVKRGMFFFAGDKIRTLSDGSAEVYFSNGTLVHVDNNSELSFKDEGKKRKKRGRKNKKRSIFLAEGRTFNKIIPGNQFEVESVHGVAAVKGTSFYADVDDDFFNVQVITGVVNVRNEQGDVDLKKNQEISVNKEEDISDEAVEVIEEKIEEIVVESPYSLQVSSPHKMVSREPFMLQLELSKKDGSRLSDSIPFTISDPNNKLKFSERIDGASTGRAYLDSEFTNNRKTVYVYGIKGDHRIDIKSNAKRTEASFMGTSLDINVENKKLKKRVIMTVNDGSGEQEIILHYEGDE